MSISPTCEAFHIAVDCAGDRWTLGVSGSLDIATGRQLIELGKVLGNGCPRSVSVDLSEIDFVDTAGLHAVSKTCALVRDGGATTSIVGASSPPLRRLLDALEGCGPSIDISDSVLAVATA